MEMNLEVALNRIRELEDAINWAAGCNGSFRMRGKGDGSYWWRQELTNRAGMIYNGFKYEYIGNFPTHLPPQPQPGAEHEHSVPSGETKP